MEIKPDKSHSLSDVVFARKEWNGRGQEFSQKYRQKFGGYYIIQTSGASMNGSW